MTLTIKPIDALNQAITEARIGNMGQTLVAAYTPFFVELEGALKAAAEIHVTDPDQAEEIQKAREARLALKRIRTGAEAKRKELKEGVIRMGRAIDFGPKLLAEQTLPVEAELEEMERIAEIQAAEKRLALGRERMKDVQPYIDPAGPIPTPEILGGMEDVYYQSYLLTVKQNAEKRAAEALAAEAARLAEEMQAEEAEAERERLEKEAEAARKEAAKARAEQEAAERKARAEAEAKEAARRAELSRIESAHQEQLRLQRAAAEAKARKEREERAKAEAELKAIQDAEAAKKRAEEEAARKAAAAPDREKLLAVQAAIRNTALPKMSTREGWDVQNKVRYILDRTANEIEELANSLGA